MAVPSIEKILRSDMLSELDIARMTMYYVDGYTIGSDWVKDSNGILDRMKRSAQNPRYQTLNEEGREFFWGMTTFDAMQRVGVMAEVTLALLIKQRSDIDIDPFELACFVDKRIKDQINQVKLD